MHKSDSKRNLKKSFAAAFRGIYLILKNERNARIHFSVAAAVTIAGFLVHITAIEWIIFLLLFAVVITAEMLNTAIEKVADLAEPKVNPHVRDLKDIAAGAVLWSSIVSVIIGIIIFVPAILQLIDSYTNH